MILVVHKQTHSFYFLTISHNLLYTNVLIITVRYTGLIRVKGRFSNGGSLSIFRIKGKNITKILPNRLLESESLKCTN